MGGGLSASPDVTYCCSAVAPSLFSSKSIWVLKGAEKSHIGTCSNFLGFRVLPVLLYFARTCLSEGFCLRLLCSRNAVLGSASSGWIVLCNSRPIGATSP
jgi:hypothetical protein